MRGDGHDCAGSIMRKHIIGDKNRHFFSCSRIDCFSAFNANPCFFFIYCKPLNFRFLSGIFHILFYRGLIPHKVVLIVYCKLYPWVLW